MLQYTSKNSNQSTSYLFAYPTVKINRPRDASYQCSLVQAIRPREVKCVVRACLADRLLLTRVGGCHVDSLLDRFSYFSSAHSGILLWSNRGWLVDHLQVRGWQVLAKNHVSLDLARSYGSNLDRAKRHGLKRNELSGGLPCRHQAYTHCPFQRAIPSHNVNGYSALFF